MKGSLKLATFAGITLFVHWTFAILIVAIPMIYLWAGLSWVAAVQGLALILAIFVCVVLHEYGHALTARRFGVPTRDITLLPIGGVARLQKVPEQPSQEFVIAMMGPIVNLFIAGILLVVLVGSGTLASPQVTFAELEGAFFSRLMWLNLFLVGFNLIPAFPMDGGRALRAGLAMRMEYTRATQIAANIGQGIAIMFGLVGLFGNFILLFIAIFVYLGAQQEAQFTMMRAVTKGVPVREAMITHFRTLTPENTLEDVIHELVEGYEEDFPVVEDGQLAGVLTRKRLLKALPEYGREATVGEVMHRRCISVDPSEMLSEAFQRMQESDCPMLPVVQDGDVVGVVTLENIGEMMMIASALDRLGIGAARKGIFSS
jgi:Zn-dependent protease